MRYQWFQYPKFLPRNIKYWSVNIVYSYVKSNYRHVNIKCRSMSIKYWHANIKCQPMNIKYWSMNIKYQLVNFKYPHTNIKYRPVNIKYLLMNIKYYPISIISICLYASTSIKKSEWNSWSLMNYPYQTISQYQIVQYQLSIYHHQYQNIRT